MMELTEPSTLQSNDWNLEWDRIFKTRKKPGDAAYWDARARTFDSYTDPSDYRKAFMACADVRPGESVFDMGCGTGSICMEYARNGHEVLGADFSTGMLAEARRRIEEHRVQGVRFKHMSWEDDWETHSLLPDSFDVAIASRSIATADMAGALAKLSTVARRRCVITLSASGNPRIDTRALDACKIAHFEVRDYQYALNILINAGYLPSLNYITSTRIDSFESLDDAENKYRASLGDLTEEQTTRLAQWLRNELVVNKHAGKPDGRGDTQKRLRLARPREFRWALISWNV